MSMRSAKMSTYSPQHVARLQCDYEATLLEHVQFFGAFLRKPADVGAVLPSSPSLARALLLGCDLQNARSVVELGPGTGVVTHMILQRMGPRTRFIAVELDAKSVRGLRRRFPGVPVYHDTAENIARYLKRQGQTQTECIISGLPWATMEFSVQHRIMNQVLAALAPNGVFTTFAYVHAFWMPKAQRFRRWLRRHFEKVEISRVVWRNVPPAFVYRCRRGTGGNAERAAAAADRI